MIIVSVAIMESRGKKMGKVLYVTDLDGTLLNTRDRISEKSIGIINALVEKGLLFTYATARSLVSASVVSYGLTTDIPVIVYNGAFIIHPADGSIISKESFTAEETRRVIEALDCYDLSVLVYSFIDNAEKVSWLTSRENEGVKRYLSQRSGDRRLHPVTTKKELYRGDMFYFTCIGEKEELQPVYDIFSKDDRFRCTLQQELYRPEFFCEIMPAGATKAHAIQKLKKIWNCDKIISFGDALNDLPMFEISDECYAVENAAEELKRAATGIIASNEEDGVAKWLSANVR